MKTKKHKRWLLPVLSCMGMMGTISTAQAAVTVYWEQDGLDVIASWSGTLDLNSALTTASTLTLTLPYDYGTLTTLHHFGAGLTNGYYFNDVGAASFTDLSRFIDDPSGETHASFGFSGSTFFWNDVHISGGVVEEVSQLSFNPTRDFIRFAGVNLSSVGADSFSNTLAWTATTTNDTISYTTGPVPSAVPEPSSTILVGLGSLALLVRRKR